MMSPAEIRAAAEQLFKAEAKRSQIDILSLAHPDMDMDDAYAIQSALVDHKQASGRSIIGWKIGLTSKAMQYALNIDIPCLLYTSPSPRDLSTSRMPSSA